MIATRVWEIKGKPYHGYREINCNNINKRKLIEQKSKLLDRQMEIGVYHHTLSRVSFLLSYMICGSYIVAILSLVLVRETK